jgi:iron complex transport system permease protein
VTATVVGQRGGGAGTGDRAVWRVHVLRLGRRVTLRYVPRALVAGFLIWLAAGTVLVLQLGVGEYSMSPGEVLATLSGRGAPNQEFIIYDLRLPRVLTAVLVGVALGMSGAIFQSITRNPLGSPDIIGFTQGAALAALVEIVIFHGSQAEIAIAAVVGGLAVSLLVYLLAYRKGVQGYRLILVGIGITAVLMSVTSYLLLRAKVNDAQVAFVWLTGSLNARGWEHVWPMVVALVVLVPLTLAMSRPLRILEMGDDTAHALGVRIGRSRTWLLFLGTALCAVAVSSAGPVGFVALAAPQIARRLTGTATVGLLPAAAMGALLLVVSDLAAQRLLAPTALPVGVATVSVGGLYLAWLLFRENKSGRG